MKRQRNVEVGCHYPKLLTAKVGLVQVIVTFAPKTFPPWAFLGGRGKQGTRGFDALYCFDRLLYIYPSKSIPFPCYLWISRKSQVLWAWNSTMRSLFTRQKILVLQKQLRKPHIKEKKYFINISPYPSSLCTYANLLCRVCEYIWYMSVCLFVCLIITYQQPPKLQSQNLMGIMPPIV